jgi:putative FmdB family regulatory protein
MPIYEYRCAKCGKIFEAMHGITDNDKLTIHEDCGGDLERLISRTSFQLKGTGWYQTDYGTKISE